VKTLHGRQCRCTGCGERFNSIAAFDRHRIGTGGERRCMTPDEMRAAGMRRNRLGRWICRSLRVITVPAFYFGAKQPIPAAGSPQAAG